MAKNNKTVITTPRGIAVWPNLNEPSKKYNKYECKLRLLASDPKVQEFVSRLEKMRDDTYDAKVAELKAEKKAALALELKKGDVVKVERDLETGEETGYLIFAASLNAGGIVKNGPRAGQPWSQKPDIFDAKGNKLKNPPRIWGGSELKLSVEAEGYVKTDKTVVVSIDLRGAQILKLVTGGQRSFSDYGFQEEDGDEITDQPLFEDETSGDESGSSDAPRHDDL